MTNRFTGEFDKQYSGVHDNGEQLTNFEVVDLLNNLSEEKEKLKKDCSNLIDDNTEYVAEINQMHKENEQLKKEIESWKKHFLCIFLNRSSLVRSDNHHPSIHLLLIL